MKPLQQFMAAAVLLFCAALPGIAHAQDNASLDTAQLEQLVAPVALYPDSLLAQVLMAATYPLEVVEAARWVKANPNLKGDDLDAALQKQSWDASVKSLAAFPQVLQMMNDKLDWTEQLGDAFLAQQKDVMAAVQSLRTKAQKEGSLTSGKEQTVKTESSGSSQVIIIESAQPDTVYVPVYNPTVVYGVWAYPAYPPYYWYPPGYAVAGNVLSFGLGLATGYALWGDMDWHHGDIDININHYHNFTHIDPPDNWHGGKWSHNPDHRRGVPYHDSRVEKQFRGTDRSVARERARTEARQDFRGHDNAARHGGDGIRHDGGARPRGDGIRQGDGARPRGDGALHGGGSGAVQRHDTHDRNRHDLNAFQDMGRGDRAHIDRTRGTQSREVMRDHPHGGGNNSFHGGGFHGGGGHGGVHMRRH